MPPLPLPLRNCLAGLILDALHSEGARRGLDAVAAVCGAELASHISDDLLAFEDAGLDKAPTP